MKNNGTAAGKNGSGENRNLKNSESGAGTGTKAKTPEEREEWKWNFRFVNLIVATTLLRILFGATAELKYEEAYYWLYAKHLDWSYFDHPPMIGWLIRLSTYIGGDGELWVRMPAILCFAGALYFMHRLAREMFGARTAFIAAAAASLLPVFEVYSIIVLPDAPLLLCWCFGLWAGYRLCSGGNPYWWLAVGAAWGLGMLSKYPALLIPAAPLLYILFKKKTELLKCWQMPLAAAAGAACTVPVIYWNASHEWASFVFQAVSRFGEANTWPEILGGSAINILVMPTPFVFGLLAWAGWLCVRRMEDDERYFYLTASFLPFAVVVAGVGLIRLVQLNWPLPVYPALIIAAAALADEYRLYAAGWGRKVLLAAAFLPALALSVLPWAAAFGKVPGISRYNEIYGWSLMGKTAAEMLSASGKAGRCFLAGHGYCTASELAYYSKLPDLTVSSNVWGERSKGFDFWTSQGDFKGWDCIYVVAEEIHFDGRYEPRFEFDEDELRKVFDSIEPVRSHSVVFYAGSPVRRYKFYHCRNYKGIPEFNSMLPGKNLLRSSDSYENQEASAVR